MGSPAPRSDSRLRGRGRHDRPNRLQHCRIQLVQRLRGAGPRLVEPGRSDHRGCDYLGLQHQREQDQFDSDVNGQREFVSLHLWVQLHAGIQFGRHDPLNIDGGLLSEHRRDPQFLEFHRQLRDESSMNLSFSAAAGPVNITTATLTLFPALNYNSVASGAGTSFVSADSAMDLTWALPPASSVQLSTPYPW